MKNFTNQYQLQKTLRFELIPQEETKAHIEAEGLLKEDEQRAEDYKKVKKIIDEYHKQFIEQALEGLKLEGLEEYKRLYELKEKTEKDQKDFEALKDKMRKQIARQFKSNKNYKRLDKKQLIKEDLIAFVKDSTKYNEEVQNRLKEFDVPDRETALSLIKKFQDFTTYFTGFHQNRQNMYTDEEETTAIAHRIVHDNLPKFLDNLRSYEKIRENFSDLNLNVVAKDLEEILQVNNTDEMFSLDFFNETLTQRGIERYNIALGGRTEQGQKKIQGINEHLNLYRQKKQLKSRDIPQFKPLYKQILSDRESVSFLPESYDDDREVLDSIKKFYKEELLKWKHEGKEKNVLKEIKALMKAVSSYKTNEIFIKNDRQLTGISNKLFDEWDVIKDALIAKYKADNPKSSRQSEAKYEEKASAWAEKRKHFRIAEIEEALVAYKDVTDEKEINEKITDHTLCDYFARLEKTEQNKKGKWEAYEILQRIDETYDGVKEMLKNGLPGKKTLRQDKQKGGSVEKIKAFLDSLIDLLHFVRPLHPKDITGEKDESFYPLYTELFDQLNKVTPLYNQVRNYVTQKPYSTEKFKLNFECGYLLQQGWAQTYAKYGGLIFRKPAPDVKSGYQYYLGILSESLNGKEIAHLKQGLEGKNKAERVIYKSQKMDFKNFPRWFINSKGDSKAPAVEKYNLPVEKVWDDYQEYRKLNTPAQKDKFLEQHIDFRHRLIDYFKKCAPLHDSLAPFKDKLPVVWRDTKEYQTLSEFYTDTLHACYDLDFEEINFEHLKELTSSKLYLFKIYNKDFSPHSKGRPNLHTLYWEALFDKRNLEDVVYKLNGEAEVFFRKKSIEKKTGHKAGQPIANKNPLNEKKESLFDYDIIKNKRYTMDKFKFHVPITLNFKAIGNEYINTDVLDYLKNNPDVHIIGIDRGERHLLYLTLIDRQGNIKKQLSLNNIISEYRDSQHKKREIKTAYREKLHQKEKERDEARKSWGTIENIKELKEGYLSQVVHQIAKIVVEHSAIVVLEDLNTGFMRGRQKVEKQVYQKFEKMLIDKLNYLVFKDKPWNEPGGVLHALQLTNKFQSFKKMGKQNGILFFVPPSYTSKIDPVTGFVNFLYPKYESVEKSKDFFKKFKSIRFNPEKKWFEFTFDYNDFTTAAESTKTKWTVCTNNERIETFRNTEKNNQWDSREIKLTDAFIALFKELGIDFKQDDLQDAIKAQNEKSFFKRLMYLLRLTVQMRNSVTGSNIDYMVSPVANENGQFFDSRKADGVLPENADANGAYNIALKGLLLLERNKKRRVREDKIENIDLFIKKKDWLQFAQNRKKKRCRRHHTFITNE